MARDIVRLNKSHDRKAFSCGVPSLDEFLPDIQMGDEDGRD